MEEKIYYKDDNVKITNLRITCNHITILNDWINRVYVDFKAATLVLSSLSFLVCFPLIFIGTYVFENWGYLGIIPLIITFVWCRMIFRTYVELKISTGSNEVKILETHMRNRDYVYKIEDALKQALVDNVKEKEQAAAAVEGENTFTPSETIILKKILLKQELEKTPPASSKE